MTSKQPTKPLHNDRAHLQSRLLH